MPIMKMIKQIKENIVNNKKQNVFSYKKESDAELKKTRCKLIRSYTFVLGFIGIIITIVVCRYIYQMKKEEEISMFTNYLTIISDKIQGVNLIENQWLTEQELKSHSIIMILDAGIPLLEHSSWMDQSQRKILLKLLEDKMKKNGIDLYQGSSTEKEIRTRYYELSEADKEYLAAVSFINTGNIQRTMLVIKEKNDLREYLKHLVIIASVWTIFILNIIFLLNVWFVGVVLQPIREGKKKQTEFIACASHELKAPLAVIQASSQAMQTKPETMMKYSRQIQKECKRMAKLVDDLLLLASTETNQWRMKIEAVDLTTIILDLYEGYEAVCHEHGIRVNLDLGEKLAQPIAADEARLQQVLSVLMDNAVQYSNSEMIEIIKKESRSYVYLLVVDHGIGIEEEKSAHIFEKFYRGDEAHNDKDHYGLGLSVARELIRMMGGMLEYAATAGGGATFIIKLRK